MVILTYFIIIMYLVYRAVAVVLLSPLAALAWIDIHLKSRDKFLESYRPATDQERADHMHYRNAAGMFHYELKRATMLPVDNNLKK